MNNQVRPKVLGYWPGKRWKQARAVFDTNAPSPAIVVAMGGKHQNNFVYVLEVKK